jgi:hypothetical protein
MTDTMLARVAASKAARTIGLKQQWRASSIRSLRPLILRFRELAYRIQELAYGGLKPETVARTAPIPIGAGDDRPIAGTRRIREWQGIEHCVTVRQNNFEYQGRPFKSLSAVACAITGTRWNGLIFLSGSRTSGLRDEEANRPQAPLRGLHARKSSEEGAGVGIQFA